MGLIEASLDYVVLTFVLFCLQVELDVLHMLSCRTPVHHRFLEIL